MIIPMQSGDRDLPPSAATLAALEEAASSAEVEADAWALPHAIYQVPKLNWDEGRGRTRGEMVYGPSQSALKILRAKRSVIRDGISCGAILFTGADEKTRLVVARRLLHLIVVFGAAFETIRQHEEANAGPNGVVVVTVVWGQRERVESLLIMALEQDQTLTRMLLRSGMSAQRIELERRLISDFLKRGGGVARHFRGPRTRRYRFSDFRLDDQVNFGVGLHLKLVFDDHEIMDFAMQRYHEFAESFEIRTEPYTLRLVEGGHASLDGANTDMLWADQSITLAAGLNRYQTRVQAAEFLEMVCGFDGVDPPISESLLSEGDAARGVTVPPGRRGD
ncbi:MAG: hypothetical protein ABI831_22500 [Betaproteobacteria bacterium]